MIDRIGQQDDNENYKNLNNNDHSKYPSEILKETGRCCTGIKKKTRE